MIAGNRVKISAAKCNISIRDARCNFDFEKLTKTYDLNMEKGFDRAIAIILVTISSTLSHMFFFIISLTGRYGYSL